MTTGASYNTAEPVVREERKRKNTMSEFFNFDQEGSMTQLNISKDMLTSNRGGQFAISENDSVADFALKIFDTTLHTLMEVRERLDPDALQRAITAAHPSQTLLFDVIIDTYEKKSRMWCTTLNRFAEVRARGRKRSMVG